MELHVELLSAVRTGYQNLLPQQRPGCEQTYEQTGIRTYRDAKLEGALPSYAALLTETGEAEALRNMGAANFALTEYQKTIEMFKLALLIWQGTGDRRRQAVAIGDIAQAHITD